MSIETYQFNLSITPGAIPPVLHLSQYDSGRTFTAILRDDANVPFELDSGATAVIKGRNAAGIAWQQGCTVSGANVTFTPSGAATDQFGVMPVTIEITESEEVISPLCVVFHIQKAGYTNEEAVLSPDFETAIQAAVAQAISEGGLGFSDEFKEALLACFNGVAWATTGGQALVDDLEAALYPDVHLVSITAAYDQDHPIYNTNTWEQICTTIGYDLIVTANYSDGTSESVSGYTLSGDLTVGTNTVTVTYQGKTDTISVVMLADPNIYGYTEVGSPSIIDNVLYPADSDGGYIRSLREFNPTGTWRMQFAVKLASQNRENLFMTADSSANRVQSVQCQAYYSAQYGYQIQFYISSTGSNWDLVSAKGFANLTVAAVQLVEYGFDGSKYYCKVSIDNGATWSEELTMVSSSTKIFGGGYITVGIAQGTTPVFSGEIYLESLKVWQGDDLWWSAVYE